MKGLTAATARAAARIAGEGNDSGQGERPEGEWQEKLAFFFGGRGVDEQRHGAPPT
jgi:hypothetical protein